MTREKNERLGLELILEHPNEQEAKSIPQSRDLEGRLIYPELDADGDHVHFEMVPMGGDSLLWLTLRRGVTPELAASSLHKIAALIERHGLELLNTQLGFEGSMTAEGGIASGPLRLDYDEHGDLVFPAKSLGERPKPK